MAYTYICDVERFLTMTILLLHNLYYTRPFDFIMTNLLGSRKAKITSFTVHKVSPLGCLLRRKL